MERTLRTYRRVGSGAVHRQRCVATTRWLRYARQVGHIQQKLATQSPLNLISRDLFNITQNYQTSEPCLDVRSQLDPLQHHDAVSLPYGRRRRGQQCPSFAGVLMHFRRSLGELRLPLLATYHPIAIRIYRVRGHCLPLCSKSATVVKT